MCNLDTRDVIRASETRASLPANLLDYSALVDTFDWATIRAELDGLPDDGGLNIAHEAVSRHALGPRRDRVALRCMTEYKDSTDITYGQLDELASRFANVLKGFDVERGATVCTLLGQSPALHLTALGTWKHRSVFCPLFTAFGPEPLQTRLAMGEAQVLVTTTALYRRRIAALRPSLPKLRHVLLIDAPALDEEAGCLDLDSMLDGVAATVEIPPTDPQTPALLHFTSGTTGRPKGAVHVHEAVLAQYASGRHALDLQAGDIYWCTADPGWVTGIVYGLIAPLVVGVTLIVDDAEFNARRWFEILAGEGVNIWYTSPTAVRMMMRAGPESTGQADLSALRLVASVGEPLAPDAVEWSRKTIGLPLLDNWWQTETGAIMIANYRSMPVRPGSMGRPLPGIEAAVVRRLHGGGLERVDTPGAVGELALKAGWPSMFRDYLGETERYRRCFIDGWYLSGDLASRDEDGYYWFVGRSDDVIKTAGHLVGPHEIERALLDHPLVANAGVIGVPDELIGERVKAYVVVKADIAENRELRRELSAHARRRLGAAIAPREIEFCRELPLTRSGKVMRRLLRARELGLPEGDTSTLIDNGNT